ncbi:MAG: relaxase domain-containing protein, partial [Longispora sp.]|nr:relaxase domain-containing protein [Longispora sp. (in: high G+C Gram-positive bacteria)]
MAYVTPIGSNPEQIEYRLTGGHGCGTDKCDRQFSYHVDGRERPLRWVGSGLAGVGIEVGSELTEGQFDTARALMNGRHPTTGEQLVGHKVAVHPDAKVVLAPLVQALQEASKQQGISPDQLLGSKRLIAAYDRAVRAVGKEGDAAKLRADHAGELADACGLDVSRVWGEGVYAEATNNLTEVRVVRGLDGVLREELVPRRISVGNRGYDLSFTLPKSYSLLLAFADEETAHAVEDIYTQQVGRTFDWIEKQCAYGMRGHHGDGKVAQTVEGSGFLGWSMVHRAARPVNGRVVGDPHWHVHVTIANMTQGSDGKWSTVAAGGRDLMRHIPAADHVMQALIRGELTVRYGVQFQRNERTNQWQVVGIPDQVLRDFSKRGASIEAMLRDLGFDPQTASRQVQRIAEAHTREGKSEVTTAPDDTLRSIWQAEAIAGGYDPDVMAAAALGRPVTTQQHQPLEAVMREVVARLVDTE